MPVSYISGGCMYGRVLFKKSLHGQTDLLAMDPPRKRTQSRAKPATPQRRTPATPKPAFLQRPTPTGPQAPQAATAHITADTVMRIPHSLILRSHKRSPPVERRQSHMLRPPTDNSGTTAIRAPHHRALRSSTRPRAARQTRTPQQPTEARQKRKKRGEQCLGNTPQDIKPEAHPPEGVG
ncbi:hypothetical protein T492DRAFT_1011392 [Pavlovales sp. CCMP2436]|nr:hypothetical protein T492DRAFT_1011392 [Pavlovales sp. CCMP2436]